VLTKLFAPSTDISYFPIKESQERVPLDSDSLFHLSKVQELFIAPQKKPKCSTYFIKDREGVKFLTFIRRGVFLQIYGYAAHVLPGF